MESNWRFNVWAFGESLGRFDLIARGVDDFEGLTIARQRVSSTVSYVWYILASEPDYYSLWIFGGAFPAHGFPYGIPVEPD